MTTIFVVNSRIKFRKSKYYVKVNDEKIVITYEDVNLAKQTYELMKKDNLDCSYDGGSEVIQNIPDFPEEEIVKMVIKDLDRAKGNGILSKTTYEIIEKYEKIK